MRGNAHISRSPAPAPGKKHVTTLLPGATPQATLHPSVVQWAAREDTHHTWHKIASHDDRQCEEATWLGIYGMSFMVSSANTQAQLSRDSPCCLMQSCGGCLIRCVQDELREGSPTFLARPAVVGDCTRRPEDLRHDLLSVALRDRSPIPRGHLDVAVHSHAQRLMDVVQTPIGLGLLQHCVQPAEAHCLSRPQRPNHGQAAYCF